MKNESSIIVSEAARAEPPMVRSLRKSLYEIISSTNCELVYSFDIQSGYEKLRQAIREHAETQHAELAQGSWHDFPIDLDVIPNGPLFKASFDKLQRLCAELLSYTSTVPSKANSKPEALTNVICFTVFDVCTRCLLLPCTFIAIYSNGPMLYRGELIPPHCFFGPNATNGLRDSVDGFGLQQKVMRWVLGMSDEKTYDSIFACVFNLLRMGGNIFYDALHSIYHIPEVTECSMAYESMLAKFKDVDFPNQLELYRESIYKLYYAIENRCQRNEVTQLSAEGFFEALLNNRKFCNSLIEFNRHPVAESKKPKRKNKNPRSGIGVKGPQTKKRAQQLDQFDKFVESWKAKHPDEKMPPVSKLAKDFWKKNKKVFDEAAKEPEYVQGCKNEKHGYDDKDALAQAYRSRQFGIRKKQQS